LFDEEQQVLKPVACDVIEYRDEVMALRLNPGQGITGTIFLTGVGEIVQDSESDPRALTIPNTPPEESSLLCVPLVVRQRVEGVVEFTRPAWMTNAKKRGVSVHVHQQLAAVHHVEGNASELREVFTNLVLNALDAMPWGGHLYVATENAGDRVIARFRDTGVG